MSSSPSCLQPTKMMSLHETPVPPNNGSVEARAALAVPRENIVRVLETILDGEGNVVVLYGQEGIGKTTVLEQFVAANFEHSFALFVSGASRWAYDPHDLATDLYTQIEKRINPKSSSLDEEIDILQLGKAYLRLRRFMDVEGWTTAYFILDGLADLPSDDESTRRQLIELLPFGRDPRFRFVLSSRQPGSLPVTENVRLESREYLLPPFSREAVRQFFSGAALDSELIEEIASVSKGIPGRLVTVRRLLASCEDARQLIQQLPSEAPELFRLEWSSVDRNNRQEMLALALLAHEHRAFTTVEIADYLGVHADAIEGALTGKTFLKCDDKGYWSYMTGADRRFAQSELESLRGSINEAIIAFHLRNPESPAALQDLPSYFTSANRLKDLVEYLSPERFARLYRTATSLTIVQQQLDRGIDAARELGLNNDLVRFTLQKSAIQEIASSETAVSEVRALTALGNIDTAIALAESESRLEAKFRLLAAIIRTQRESQSTPEPDLVDRVRRMSEAVDPDDLGEQRVAVALDLLHALPDVAIGLVSETRHSATEGEHGFDWGVLRLTIEAQITEADPNDRRYAEKQHENVSDPGLRTLSTAATLLFAGAPAERVLSHVDGLQGASEQLFILSHWILANRSAPGAAKVLEAALRVAVQAKGYAANASVYRQIATALPHLSTVHEAEYYINAFDAQRAVLERAGPDEDFFRVQLILARTQWRWDKSRGLERLLDLYTLATRIDDPVVRLAATARLAGTLARVDPGQTIESDLREIVDHELEERLEDVLRWSAEHIETTAAVVQALAGPLPAKVLEIIPRINTEWRRDRVYRDFVREVSTAPTEEISPPEVHSALDAIVDPQVYDSAVDTLVNNLGSRQLTQQEISNCKDLLLRSVTLKSAAKRAKTCARLAAAIGGRSGAHNAAAEQLLNEAKNAWNALETDWKKLQVTAEIIASLARVELEEARAYAEAYNSIKQRLVLLDAETVTAARIGLLLALRAYGGLVAHRLAEIDRDEARLLDAIEQFGTLEDQSILLSDLATYYYFAGLQDRCSSIIKDRLTPILYALPNTDPLHRANLFVAAYPAVHLGAPGTASAMLAELDDVARDEAMYNAAWVILTKAPVGEPVKDTHGGFEIGYEEASRVIELMEEMEVDASIYALLLAVVNSLDPAEHPGRVNRQQMAALINRLNRVTRDKFPNDRFIRHSGYAVVADAQLNRIRLRSDAVPTERLTQRALEISNVSDRAYVLGIIAGTIRDHRDRGVVLDLVVTTLDSLPLLADRIERYTSMSETLISVDLVRSKEMARKAQQLLLGGESASTDARRRALLSVSRRIGPEFAASISSAFSDDPAKDQVEQQMQLYALADSITAARRRSEPLTEPQTPLEMSRAAWLKLGELNAGLTR